MSGGDGPAEPVPEAGENEAVLGGPLPGDALVIRGGLMANLEEMLASILEEHQITGRYGLSVFSRPGLTADQIAEFVGSERLPHSQMRATTVQLLRESAPDVISDEQHHGPAHALIVWHKAPTLPELDTAVQRFGAPQPNPVKRA